MRFIFHIEEGLGRTVSTSRLRLDMRPSEIDAEIRREDVADPRDASRIFFLPGVGGDEPRLMRLRAGLPHTSFAVLRYPDWHEAFGADWGMEQLSYKFADSIEARQPRGPINLAGYSFGADVAFAIALELNKRGREIHRIFAFDHPSPAAPSSYEWAPLPLIDRVKMLFSPQSGERMAFKVANAILRRRNQKLLSIAQQCLHHVRLGKYRFMLHQALLETERLMMAREWRTCFQLPSSKLKSHLVLFRAELPANRSRDLGWDSVCERVSIISIPGDHRTIFEGDALNLIIDGFTRVQAKSARV